MRALLVAVGIVASVVSAGCGGGGDTTDACLDSTVQPPKCTNFTAGWESNQFNCCR